MEGTPVSCFAPAFSLTQCGKTFFEHLERFTARSGWRIKAALFAALVALLVNFPKIEWVLAICDYPFSQAVLEKYDYLGTPYSWGHWEGFEKKVSEPFAALDYSPDKHEAKTAYRFAVPLITRLLGLSNLVLILAETCLAIGFFYCAVRLVESSTSDRVAAVLFAVVLAPLLCGYSGVLPLGGKFDGVAFFALMAAMAASNPALIALGIQLACWTDERAIPASLIVLVFWLLCDRTGPECEASTFRITPRSAGIVASVAIYFSVRLLIQFKTGLHTPVGTGTGVELGLLGRMTELYWTGIWSALRGGWLVVLVLIAVWLRRCCLLPVALVVGASLPNIIGAFVVYDVSRSASYVFPLLCIAVVETAKFLPRFELRWMLLITALVNFVSSPLHLVAGAIPSRWPFGLVYVADQPLINRIVEYFYYLHGY